MTESDTENNGGDDDGNPVREMFILAALYLPLAFFLWFSFASALMWLPGRLVEWGLTVPWPRLFEDLVQLGFRFEIQTLIRMPQPVQGRVALLNLESNPMIYAWGMALLFGLTMATPMSGRRRIVQLFVGYLVVSAVTAWGVFWETWVDLAFGSGPTAAAAVAATSLPPTLIALFYQLGYLMLPAVVPLAAWILMNRPFLERVAFDRAR